ncbi:MAG TPA: hypothetical protein DD669_21760 [Pseudomonas sp.]|nr:hypothetical protein CJF37_16755 [Pseudomonas fragi]HBP50422.1 hypothetical protein [Pseudomonas sp.]
MGLYMSETDVNLHSASVSVVIPCYRCEETIRRAVDSVYKQTWRPLEVILVDDCSPDQTLEALKAIKAQYPEGWVRIVEIKTNGGPGNARNMGWASAKGDYVAFLDADDSWHPCKTEQQYSWMLKNTEVSLTGQQSTLHDSLDPAPVFANPCSTVSFRIIQRKELLLSNKFSTSSVMVKVALAYRFVDSRSYSEDYELWCDVAFDSGQCHVMNQALTYTHKAIFGVSGLSSNLWKMEQGELLVYRKLYKQSKIGLPDYMFYSAWSMLRYFRRCIKVYLAGS